MKTFELFENIGLFLMKSCIVAGVAGITFTAVGFIGECEDLSIKNLGLQCVTEHLDKENRKLKEELKTLKEQAVEAVETVTKVREKKKVEA